MSIASLATGDQVVVQSATSAAGAMGGVSRTWADGPTLDCLIQTMSAQESRRFGARGGIRFFNVFFSADPGFVIPQNYRLKWTVQGGETLATPVYLRMLDQYSEGRPGETLLWIFNCEVETTRTEN